MIPAAVRGVRVSSVVQVQVQVHLPAQCPNFLQRVPAHPHTATKGAAVRNRDPGIY